MGHESAQCDAGDVSHETAQPGGGMANNHAVNDGSEEGGPGGPGLPVPGVSFEVRSVNTGEVLLTGQDIEQGAQEDAQSGRILPGGSPMNESE